MPYAFRTVFAAALFAALGACSTPQVADGSARALTNDETQTLLRHFDVQRLMSDGVIVVSQAVLESYNQDGTMTRLGHHIRQAGTYSVRNALICTRTSTGYSECWRFYLDADGRYFTRAASGGELLPAQLEAKKQEQD